MKKRTLSFALALLMVLSALPTAILPIFAVTEDGVQENQTVSNDESDPYASLYVQDNLLFRWDAFDSVASSAAASNLTLADRDGRNATITLSKATAEDGFLASTANLDFSTLIPKDGKGNYKDVTVEMSMKQVSYTGTSKLPTITLGTIRHTQGTAKPVNESYGYVQGLYAAYRNDKTENVVYYFDANGLPTTGDKAVSSVSVPYLPTSYSSQSCADHTWGSPSRVLGNYVGESFSLSVLMDYTVDDETNGYGSLSVKYIRDLLLSGTVNYSYLRGFTAERPKTMTLARKVPSTQAEAEAMKNLSPAANMEIAGLNADDGKFIIGGNGIEMGYYTLRIYDDVLSEAEYKQNHFADLAAYHRIDNVDMYLSLNSATRATLHNQFAEATIGREESIYNTSYEDVTKEELDKAILEAYAAEQGLFDRTYMTFDGYQLSLYTGVGIRARYSLSKKALAELPEGMTLAEIGVLSADAADFEADALTVSQDENGTFVAPEGVKFTCVQKNGTNLNGVLLDDDDTLVFADTRLCDGAPTEADIFSEYVYRAYAVFMNDNNPIVVYTDATGETEAFKNGISLYEASAVLCGQDVGLVDAGAVRKVLLIAMNNLDRLQGAFDDGYAAFCATRNGAIGEGSTYAKRVAEVESILAETKDARNKAFTEANATKRAAYLQTAGANLATLTNYANDMASFRKNEASATANELLACLSAMKSEYANLRAFADAMKLENADELFADMQGKIEEAETLYRTFLPTVKATSDHFAAVKSVLNSFWNEINEAKGDGSGVTQIFLFGASTTTTASYPTLTHFPFQGMGYEFDEYFDDTVRIVNPSKAGWSLKALTGSAFISKTNLDELFAPENSLWAKMLMQLNPGDYVIFGSTCTNEKWQTDGDVYYVENEDGTYSLADESTPGAKFYSVKQSEASYQEMLINCFEVLIDMGVTPIIHTSTGNIGLSSSKPNANDTSRFTGGTKSYEEVKIKAVNAVNEYYQTKNGTTKGYAYHADTAERCREVYLRDMQNGLTFEEVVARYNQTQGAIEEFYATYGYVGSKYEKHITTSEKFKVDYVHQNIRGALLVSSFTLKELQGTDIPLLDHIVTYELNMEELVCNTLKEAGVTYTDPRK